jgi:hypothetical protein
MLSTKYGNQESGISRDTVETLGAGGRDQGSGIRGQETGVRRQGAGNN